MAEDEVDFSKLPLEERCTHKNWKARVAGYEELIKVFKRIDDEKSPEWNKYSSIVRKLPVDSNAAALEKGLEATFIFVENSAAASKLVSEVMSGIVSKCIIAAKARSKELASEISLMFVEIEKYEIVQEELMKGMDHKNPRIVSGCIAIITQSVKEFGPKVVNLKTLLKKVLPLIEDRDKGVRDEVKKLNIEIYHWLGAGYKPQLQSLKPVVLQELEAEFAKLDGKPQQQRYLRSQQAKKERMAMEGGDTEVEGEEEAVAAAPEIDPYDLLDPVDILSKLSKDFYEKTEAKKWQERKEAMDELEKLTSNPKLEPGDYSDLVRALKRIISKDSNVVVVAIAVKCLAGLANGLKKKFAPYSASCVGTILEKFKEKKAAVVTAMREAIDACFVSTSLEQIQEDVIESLKSKNPAVKTETASFLARAFTKVPNKTMVDKKLMKPYHTQLLVNVNESDPAVRDAAAEALGVALKAAGEKSMGPLLQDLDPMKLQKIKDFAKTAVVLAPKPAPAPVKPPPKAAPAKSEAPAKSAPAANAPPKKAPSPKKPTAVVRKPVEKEIPQSSSLEELNEPNNKSPPSATNVDDGRRIDISSQLPSHLIDSLSDKNWKTRDEALDKISAVICSVKNIQPNLGDLPTALSERLQDSNRNLSANAFLVCQNLATALGPHCKQHLPTLLPNMLAGLSDSKPTIRNTVIACINAWAENAGIKEVFQREVIADALKAGNPYLRQEVFQWLTVRLPTLKTVNKDDLHACIPYVYACIEDRNPDVRKRAQEVVVPFMIHLGHEGMSRATTKLKPSSKTAIQAILDKARTNLPAKPSASATNTKAAAGAKTGLKQPSGKSAKEAHASNSSLNKTFDSGPVADDKSRTITRKDKPSGIGQGRPQPTKAGSPGSVPGDYSPPPSNEQSSPEHVSPPPVNANTRREQYNNLNSNMISANHSMPSAIGMGNHVPEVNRYTLPQQYQINYEMIDNMFGSQDLMPMPALQLYDTNIEHISNEVPVKLPARRIVTLPQLQMSNIPVLAPKAAQAIDLTVFQVGNSDLRLSMEAIVQLESVISDPEVATVMGERVDHLLSSVTMQLRKLQPMLSSSPPETLQEMNKLYRCIVQLLQALFKQGHSPLAHNGTKNTVRELIYNLLTLIIDPNVTVLQDATFICKTVNVLVVRIIEHSDANAVICGLIRLLNDTLQNQAANARLLELVMKCQWKLLKQFSDWGEDHNYTFDLDSIIREFHAFIKVNPFMGPNSRDLTPIKTMKTILHALVMHVGGDKVLKALYKMPDLKGSETEIYISKLISRESSKKRSEPSMDRNSNARV